jgi:Zn-dependent protease
MLMLIGEGFTVSTILSFFAVAVIIFLVFPIHECSHGLMARFLGDDTAERAGRLTLNPLAHIDWMGALFMLFVPIGWAKPVPVDPRRCTKVKAKTAMALTALAGPLANIVLAYISIIIAKILLFGAIGGDGNTVALYIAVAFQYIAVLDVYLAVFNLLPIPPLDGSKILFFFLKPRAAYSIMRHQQVISIVFMLLLFSGFLSGVLGITSNWIMGGLNFLTGYVDAIAGVSLNLM